MEAAAPPRVELPLSRPCPAGPERGDQTHARPSHLHLGPQTLSLLPPPIKCSGGVPGRPPPGVNPTPCRVFSQGGGQEEEGAPVPLKEGQEETLLLLIIIIIIIIAFARQEGPVGTSQSCSSHPGTGTGTRGQPPLGTGTSPPHPHHRELKALGQSAPILSKKTPQKPPKKALPKIS